MYKGLVLFIIFFSAAVHGQSDMDSIPAATDSLDVEMQEETISYFTDSIYEKDLLYDERRALPRGLKDKYSGKEFTYVDDLKKPAPKKKSNPLFGKGFFAFMSTIFPFLLVLLIVLIVMKALLNVNINFRNFRKAPKGKVDTTPTADENIEEMDIEALLRTSIQEKKYRLATRYYYLFVLKKLSDGQLITYNKEKTNAAYLFEIKDTAIRSHFSYLLYIYNYVWYGEFAVDEIKFQTIENKYKSFINRIQ